VTHSEDAPLPVCRKIRSKGAGIVYGDPVTWEAGYRSTANFWCVVTGDAIGPDDGFVHPHVCVSARQCFCGNSDVDNASAAAGGAHDPNRVA
jgi:hypothetical protein